PRSGELIGGVAKKSGRQKRDRPYPTQAQPVGNEIPTDDLNALPVATKLFTLGEDGSIQATDGELASDQSIQGLPSPPLLAYRDEGRGVWLYHGNCLELLDAIAAKYPDGRFDCIFADPPYFLSNGGITCHAGKMVKVDKGNWDKSRGTELNHEFNIEWL